MSVSVCRISILNITCNFILRPEIETFPESRPTYECMNRPTRYTYPDRCWRRPIFEQGTIKLEARSSSEAKQMLGVLKWDFKQPGKVTRSDIRTGLNATGAKRVGRSEIVFRKSVVTRLLLPKWVQTRKRRERDTLNNNPFAILVRFPFFFRRMTFCISYGFARTTRHLPSCLAPICLTYCDKAQFISKKARETNMEKDKSCGYKRGTL